MTTNLTALWRSGDFADAYLERNRNVERIPKVREVVLETRPRSMLEAGANAGLNLRNLSGLVPVIVGLDVNEKALAEMQATCPGAIPVVGEIQRLPFLDNAFDLTICVGVLIHVPPRDLDAAMGQLYRVTKPGGHVLIAEYDAPIETVVPYRGQEAALFKRPYLERFGAWRSVSLVWERQWTKADGWDDVTARLWRKP